MQFKGQSKMVSLVKIQQQRGVDEDEQRVAYFLDTSGFNTGFSRYYLVCKLMSVMSPFAMWYYLCGFIGSHFSAYGLDVLMNFMDQGKKMFWISTTDLNGFLTNVNVIKISKFEVISERDFKIAEWFWSHSYNSFKLSIHFVQALAIKHFNLGSLQKKIYFLIAFSFFNKLKEKRCQKIN